MAEHSRDLDGSPLSAPISTWQPPILAGLDHEHVAIGFGDGFTGDTSYQNQQRFRPRDAVDRHYMNNGCVRLS